MIGKRLVAFLIDLILVSLFGAVFQICIRYIGYVAGLALVSIVFAVFFCRDIFTGRSLGRRICGLSVVDADSFHPVSEFRALVRNLFIVVWPIELVVLFLKKRRLGDIVTHTDVVEGNIIRRVTWVGILLFMAVWAILFVMLYIVYQNPLIRLLYQ